jgi:UDP-N-acetylmuramoyl-tripeptide--D-alanyl-D-alanine ligase
MRLIDDTYNANPASLSAALTLLGRQPNQRWLVFGDMGELGASAAAAHRQAGVEARAAGIDRLFGIGEQARAAVEAFGTGAQWYPDVAAALADLERLDGANATVLLKGSRFMRLDRIVDALTAGAGHDDVPQGSEVRC